MDIKCKTMDGRTTDGMSMCCASRNYICRRWLLPPPVRQCRRMRCACVPSNARTQRSEWEHATEHLMRAHLHLAHLITWISPFACYQQQSVVHAPKLRIQFNDLYLLCASVWWYLDFDSDIKTTSSIFDTALLLTSVQFFRGCFISPESWCAVLQLSPCVPRASGWVSFVERRFITLASIKFHRSTS